METIPELEQKFEFNERTKELTVTTERDTNKVKQLYKDTFSEPRIRELYRDMKKAKSDTEQMIQNFKKQIEDLNETEKHSKIKLTDSQKQLIEDLKIIKRYEPIENGKTKKKQLNDQLEVLNKELKDKKRIINQLRTTCKIKLE